MPFRFVHTADVHLDSPLRSLTLRDPRLGALIGTATRRAFEATIDLCLTEQADALMIAGDLYDGDQTSMKTARFLGSQMQRLHEAGIAAFVIRGNHDARSSVTRALDWPDNVTVFGGRAEAIRAGRADVVRNGRADAAGDGRTDATFPVVVHGVSFAQPSAPESLLPKFRPPVPDAVNIGLLHTSLAGSEGHDDYAPCSIADLDAAGFQYWALGHIHRRSVHVGNSTIVMPGIPQGRDINEDGPKSVSLVTIADDRTIHVEERPTSLVQFLRLPIGMEGADDWDTLIDRIGTSLRQARDSARSEHLIVRPRLHGASPLAWRMRRDADLLKVAADARVPADTWVELLEIECRAPDTAAGDGADPVLELRRSIETGILGSEAFRAEAAAMAGDLARVLPPDCRDALGVNEAEATALLDALAREGAEDILARLVGTRGG